MGIGEAILGPTLPSLASQTSASIAQISFLFTALGSGHMIGAFAGGRLYDFLRGHTVTFVMLLVIAAVFFFIPVIPILWVLTMVIFLLGLAQGAMDVGVNTQLIWVWDAASAPFLNALQFFFGLGAFISPVIIAQSRQLTGSVKSAYWLAALVMLPVALWMVAMRSPRSHVQSTEEAPASDFNPRLVFLLAVFLMLYIGVLVGFSGWIYTIVTTEGLIPLAQADYLVSAFWGALTIGRLIMVPISSRVKPLKLLYFDILGCTASVAAFILFRESTTAIWGCTIALGLFIASVFPSAIAHANKYMHMNGKVTGMTFLGGNTGTMLIPLILGQIFAARGGTAVLVAILVDLFLTLAMLVVLSVYSRKLVSRN